MVYVEAIREGEIVRVSEEQARVEELFILRNIPEIVKKEISETPKTLDLTKVRGKERFEAMRRATYKKNNVLKELKDNFHWDILKKRRTLGLSRKQFADRLGETEERLKIVENGNLPEDNFALIIKIERTLSITLRKESQLSNVNLAELQKAEEEKKKVQKEAREANILGDDIEVID